MLRSEKKFIDQALEAGSKLPEALTNHPPAVFVRSLRKRLRMTQKQLAKRVGIPQSYIAKIESGHKKPTIETLEKIFRGLYCSLTILPIPEKNADQLLEEQALVTAEKNVKYVSGTMALEAQRPSKPGIREMIEEEKNRLLKSETTKIWD
ncbi:MAG TPA: helix-turn-helix domain-containing protein [Chlamydiales bacterium]|nr:helix-turn-helix domain-containing protein [Chlamydiales bacterium]